MKFSVLVFIFHHFVPGGSVFFFSFFPMQSEWDGVLFSSIFFYAFAQLYGWVVILIILVGSFRIASSYA